MKTRTHFTKAFMMVACCLCCGTMLYAQEPATAPAAIPGVAPAVTTPPPPIPGGTGLQAPPPAPGMLPPPPGGPGLQAPPPPPSAPAILPPPPPGQLQEVQTYTGTIVSLAANDEFIYDGYYLADHADTLLVKFPPHLGATLKERLKSGAKATVTGTMNLAPTGQKEISMLSVSTGGKTFSDTGVSPVAPAPETFTSGSGKITSLQLNRENILAGLLIDNNTVLRIPPLSAMQLASSLQVGSAVAFTGMKRALNAGEALQGNYTLVHCQTITVNGHQYLAQ